MAFFRQKVYYHTKNMHGGSTSAGDCKLELAIQKPWRWGENTSAREKKEEISLFSSRLIVPLSIK